MAKVVLSQSQRATDRLNGWILMKMRELDMNQQDVGDIIGIHGKNIGDRLNKLTPWKFWEAYEVVAGLGGRLEDIL